MDLWDHPNLSYMAEKYGHNEKITSEPSSTKGIIISVVILLVLTVAIIWHWEIFCFTYNAFHPPIVVKAISPHKGEIFDLIEGVNGELVRRTGLEFLFIAEVQDTKNWAIALGQTVLVKKDEKTVAQGKIINLSRNLNSSTPIDDQKTVKITALITTKVILLKENVNASIIVNRKNANLIVPKSIILQGQGYHWALMYKNQTICWQKVSLGFIDEDNIEIISDIDQNAKFVIATDSSWCFNGRKAKEVKVLDSL